MNNMTNTQDLDLVSDDYCEKCGDSQAMVINMLGTDTKVRKLCDCQKIERDKRIEEEKNRDRQMRLEKLRNNSLMDDEFKKCTFQNFIVDDKNKKMYDLAKRYCNKWPQMKKENVGILFHGKPGRGKTFLTFCIANELLGKGVPLIAMSTLGLLSKIKATYGKWGDAGEVQVINSLKNASLLILDDLGAENSTTWTKEKLYEIIDSRYRNKKPMIVSTNLTLEQLKNKLTTDDGVTRTYDRLIEMCYPLEIKGYSRRIKTAKEKEKIIQSLLS